MSHIFDALQKSAGEDGEIELPSTLLPTQLLEATERRTAAARASAAVLEEPSLPIEIAALAGMRQSLDAGFSRNLEIESAASTELPIINMPLISSASFRL
jgi:hypothetical protein